MYDLQKQTEQNVGNSREICKRSKICARDYLYINVSSFDSNELMFGTEGITTVFMSDLIKRNIVKRC